MIIKMIQELGKRMETQTEMKQTLFIKELEDLKNKQRWSIQITKVKNTLESLAE